MFVPSLQFFCIFIVALADAGGWQALGTAQNTLQSPGPSAIPAPYQLRVRYLIQDAATDIAVDATGSWYVGVKPLGTEGNNFSLCSFDEYGQARWVARASARIMAPPVVLPDGSVAYYLDTANCILFAVDGITGAEVKAVSLPDCNGTGPVLRMDADGTLFVFGAKSSYAIDSSSLAILHTYQHSGPAEATAAIGSAHVLVATVEGLVAFNKTTGSVVWTFRTAPLQGAALVAEAQGSVVVLIQPPGYPDQLSCLSLATGAVQWQLNASVNAGFIDLLALSADGNSIWCSLDNTLTRINLATHEVTPLDKFRYLQKPIIVDPRGDLFFVHTPHLETLLLRVSPIGPTILANYSAELDALRCLPSLSAIVPNSRLWLGCLSGLAYLTP
eukprot:TRINITY_DN55486_c0_g1_i1.p1 TRINITY_DN55486_c0_g1~~TRINITY_DN55486_c0_g1_i1.p1  ORF type:complete len:396 (+),score=41.85 TRINITY_DN55486_c0_g1_i1:28-1188(+)